ncbi:MAG: TonB-dependent receptor [Bacteroidaceae bacterium]|nr:TonB-dependent receptor [Bacteroidaceae bacterium]
MKTANAFLKFLVGGLCFYSLPVVSQTDNTLSDDSLNTVLEGVTVSAHRPATMRVNGPVNGVIIGRQELFKAACCNLGESFTTNPSVDVNYSDATTGAKQIKLLGLSGTYVQMLTENLPNFRGAAQPFALDYVPGPWMNSIQVSKGASSVRNGYESITGQIDVEYLKPDDEQGVAVNLYANSLSRFEANADANLHVNKKLSSEILLHYQDDFAGHDINNDGFLDQPDVSQWNLQNRWKWKTDRYLFHGGTAVIKEKRRGGQTHHTAPNQHRLFQIGVETDRYEAYMKHAFFLDENHGTNIALMGNFSHHETNAEYGERAYRVNEQNAYAQLLFETNLSDAHNISAGLSLNHDYLGQTVRNTGSSVRNEKETITGAYAQYTFNHLNVLTLMAGARLDRSSLYGTFFTPRFHLKYLPNNVMSIRLSAGKGYRTPHALAENHNLLASGRKMVIDDDLRQEEAWNYGASTSLYIPLAGKTMKLNVEYYHTHFSNQTLIDYDSNPSLIHIANMKGKSFSNTWQFDVNVPVIQGLELTAAYRLNDVKATYDGKLRTKPLTSRYKGLITVSYKTPLEKWQMDVTFQQNGGGRLPDPYVLADGNNSWSGRFHSYGQLNAQVTRWFRHFSVYVGGENLTGFRQKHNIINADNPWTDEFEPTLVWGPVHGAIAYMGVRINMGKL